MDVLATASITSDFGAVAARMRSMEITASPLDDEEDDEEDDDDENEVEDDDEDDEDDELEDDRSSISSSGKLYSAELGRCGQVPRGRFG
jgi:TATA-binding protein-associated factor Taf7